MSQLTCIACQKPIYRGERVLSAEFGTVVQSTKSQRDTIAGYAVDILHFACIPIYMGHITGNEMSEEVRKHLKTEIRREVVTDMREELRQEVYDEVLEEFGRTCALCSAELEGFDDEEDPDPIVQSAMVTGQQAEQVFTPPPLPPSPFGPPINFIK